MNVSPLLLNPFSPHRTLQAGFLGFLLLLLVANPMPSSASTADFSAANTLYEQQKFTEAVATYQEILKSGMVSPNVFFNLGNAHFKSGEFGKAIAAYRQAQRLAPRDPDIRANLRFAREKAQNTGAAAADESWLDRLTANEWLLAASIPFWLCFLLLTFGQVRNDWQKIVRAYAMALGVLTVGFGICAGIAVSRNIQRAAVVISNEAVVRHGPFEQSQSAFNLRDGAELTVLDQRENWIQVSAGANRIGWIPAKQVTVIN